MISLFRFLENKESKNLRKLKNSGSYVRVNSPAGIFFGKINDFDKKHIMLSPHTKSKNFPLEVNSHITRIYLEEETPMLVPRDPSMIEQIDKGYINSFISTINYFSKKNIKNSNLGCHLFEGYPLPSKEEIAILEGESPKYLGKNLKTPEKDSKDNFSSQGKIGFRY